MNNIIECGLPDTTKIDIGGVYNHPLYGTIRVIRWLGTSAGCHIIHAKKLTNTFDNFLDNLKKE